MKKRLLSGLMSLVMLLSLVPAMGVTASAGEMLPFHEVGTYQELRSAILRGKSRIKLKNDINTRDVYASGVGIPEDQMITIGYDEDITLDLNGCTLALETLVSGGISFFTVYGELEIKDSSPGQTGKITGKFPARLASMFHTRGGTLTLQSGTLMTYSDKNDVIKVGSSGGHVVINGGRICSGIWDTSSTSPCGYAVLAVTGFVDVEEMEVIINGGVFDGAVGFFPLSEFTCEKPRFHIYGGTFKKDVLLRCGQKTFKTHSPILEICGGSFEGGLKIYDWGMDLVGNAAQSYPPFKLLGGTFSCTMDLCYEKSSWGFYSPNLDQIIDALNYERTGPVFAAMFENSAIVKPSGTYTADYIGKGMDWAEREGYGGYYQMLLKGTAANPVKIVPNAWDLKEVLLDGSPIKVPNIRDGAAFTVSGSVPIYTVSTLGTHELVYRWYDLAKELKDAGWSYEIRCERGPRLVNIYDGSYTTANGICEWRYRLPNTPANIDAGQTAFTVTIKNPSGVYVSHAIYANQYLLRYQVVKDTTQPVTAGRLNMSGGDIIASDAVSANSVTLGARENRFTVSSQSNWSSGGGTRSKTVTLKAADGYRFTSASTFSVEGANCVTAKISSVSNDAKTCVVRLEARVCSLLTNIEGKLENFYDDRTFADVSITSNEPDKYRIEIYTAVERSYGEVSPVTKIDGNSWYYFFFDIYPEPGYAVRSNSKVSVFCSGGYWYGGSEMKAETYTAIYDDWVVNDGGYTVYPKCWCIGRNAANTEYVGIDPRYESAARTLYLSIKMPVAGESPTDASYQSIGGLPSDVKVKELKWYMDGDTVFQAGKKYRLGIDLEIPKQRPNTVWPEDYKTTVVYINGVNAWEYDSPWNTWGGADGAAGADTTVYNWGTFMPYTVPGGNGGALYGKVQSYGPKSAATVKLMQNGAVKYTVTTATSSGSGQTTKTFRIPNVAPGRYDLVVSKPGHLSYTVKGVVVSNGELDLTAHRKAEIAVITLPAGDVNGDGTINSEDLNMVWKPSNYLKGASAAENRITDVNGDGTINSEDLNVIWMPANYLKDQKNCTTDF